MKTSYEEIKNYIFEKYGKRVKNKWIAEVKREEGLLVFSVENEEIQEECPEKAKKYILEAFDYFMVFEDKPNFNFEK